MQYLCIVGKQCQQKYGYEFLSGMWRFVWSDTSLCHALRLRLLNSSYKGKINKTSGLRKLKEFGTKKWPPFGANNTQSRGKAGLPRRTNGEASGSRAGWRSPAWDTANTRRQRGIKAIITSNVSPIRITYTKDWTILTPLLFWSF